MVRAIDAEKLKNEVKSVFHGALGLTVTEVVHEIINRQPTLTPPNETLTCEGCVYLEQDTAPCAYCVRMKQEKDYYRRAKDETD